MLKIITSNRWDTIIANLAHLNAENHRLHALQFRVGDCVFINDGKRNPLTPYYLHEHTSTLAGPGFLVSENKEEKRRLILESGDGALIKYLRTEPPKTM